jgi:hypothetical protein
MRRLLNILPVMLSLLPFAVAQAEEKVVEKHLNVDWREAQIISIDGMAASVVIGDPTVADVSLEDPHTLILFGKGTGETNLLVLGPDHKLIFNSSVTVSPENARHVSVFGSPEDTAAETLFACGARCVRVLSPTDIEFQSKIKAETNSKSNSSQDATEQSTVDAASGGGGAPATVPPAP